MCLLEVKAILEVNNLGKLSSFGREHDGHGLNGGQQDALAVIRIAKVEVHMIANVALEVHTMAKVGLEINVMGKEVKTKGLGPSRMAAEILELHEMVKVALHVNGMVNRALEANISVQVLGALHSWD